MITVIPDYQENVPHGKQIKWVGPHGEHTINPAYLHGSLSDKAGFDIVYHPPGRHMQEVYLNAESGEMQVEVVMDAGHTVATLVWWFVYGDNRATFRGLIVEPGDERSFEYARQAQAERREFL